MQQGLQSDRTVLITGASSGIGLACAVHLAQSGFRVFAGVRREEDGETLKRKSGGAILPLFMDVTDQNSVAAARDRVSDAVGAAGLSGLVNNAGIVVSGPLEFIPPDQLRKQFDVNVLGQVSVTQAFLPLLRTGRGRIVFMGSISGRMSTPFLAPYSASKFALEAITDSLRMEVKPWGITVSLIEPGSVKTPIWKKSIAAADAYAREFPPEASDLYGSQLKKATEGAKKMEAQGIDVAVVARTVEHALTSNRPKTRYLLGRGVNFQAFMKKVLPDRLMDRIILRIIGLPG